MTSSAQQTRPEESHLDATQFDFSQLVGHNLMLFSKQFPGRSLKSRVVLVSDREITIDRSGSSGLIDSLVNNQKVTIQVDYKGQQVAVPATLRRNATGACKIILGEKVVPLRRRRFTRVTMSCPVKLAAVPVATFNPQKLAHLRWLETVTINVSPGGTLIDFTSRLESPTYLFMNIALKDFSFPSLVLGQVLYSLPGETGHFHVGVEFIVREIRQRRFPRITLKRLPPEVFEYNEAQRRKLNNNLAAWMQKTSQS